MSQSVVLAMGKNSATGDRSHSKGAACFRLLILLHCYLEDLG